MSHDGRFAPSPTGPLHLGSLRTALVAWLFARSKGAQFRLRVEDLDPQRCRREWAIRQMCDLRAVGIDWDGEPVWQSERLDLYERAITRLTEAERVYPCFCTRAEIRDAASAPHGQSAEGAYPGSCRNLSSAERRRREQQGRRPALRLRTEGERITWADELLGYSSGVVDDFVIRRSDGVPAYQIAVVVDDALQGVTEVVRGADLADSTPRQILLQQLLDLPRPVYAHVPLVFGPDGARLAKRHGAAAVRDLDGSPALTLGFLAHSLGLALGRTAVPAARALLADFDPARVPTAPVLLEA